MDLCNNDKGSVCLKNSNDLIGHKKLINLIISDKMNIIKK